MKIAVVGSINMDMIIHADRIPLKGETIKGDNIEFQPGGKGANQAVAMAKLGADVFMYGCVGADNAGKNLIENLKSCSVNTEAVEVLEGVPSGQAMITIGEEDNTIVIIPGANQQVDISYVERHKVEILESDIIVLQNEIPEETIVYTIQMCHEHKKIILWNPAPARELDEKLVDLVTYITPNEHETCIIWKKEDKSMDTINELLKKYPGKLIVTQGEKGVGISMDGKTIQMIPAMKVKVVDTTGAGDTLNGAFCVGISRGMNEIEALKFANTAAGLSVKKVSAQGGMPTLDEVNEVLTMRN